MLIIHWCSDAGNRLFCGREWIDPVDPDGRTLLEIHYQNLSILFSAFAAACARERFIDAWSTAPPPQDGSPPLTCRRTRRTTAGYGRFPTPCRWVTASIRLATALPPLDPTATTTGWPGWCLGFRVSGAVTDRRAHFLRRHWGERYVGLSRTGRLRQQQRQLTPAVDAAGSLWTVHRFVQLRAAPAWHGTRTARGPGWVPRPAVPSGAGGSVPVMRSRCRRWRSASGQTVRNGPW